MLYEDYFNSGKSLHSIKACELPNALPNPQALPSQPATQLASYQVSELPSQPIYQPIVDRTCSQLRTCFVPYTSAPAIHVTGEQSTNQGKVARQEIPEDKETEREPHQLNYQQI